MGTVLIKREDTCLQEVTCAAEAVPGYSAEAISLVQEISHNFIYTFIFYIVAKAFVAS